jgi:hypothetical protein
MCGSAFAGSSRERSPEECKAFTAYLEGLSVLTNDMLEVAKKSETNNSLISQLLTHETKFRNSWVVSDGYKGKWKSIESALGDHEDAFREYVLPAIGNYSHTTKVDALFDSSLEIDLGDPDDGERAKAMVKLKSLCKEISEQCVKIRGSYYASNFGEVALLSPAEQTALYVQWLRFKRQLLVLRTVLVSDQSKVSAGSMELECLTHYDVSGRNYWGLARKYKNVITDIANRIHNSYHALASKGIEPNRTKQMEALDKLGGKIEWDLGKAEADDAYNAVEKTKKLVEQGLGNFSEFDGGFKANVKDSAKIIAAAEKQFASGANDAVDTGNTNDTSGQGGSNDTSAAQDQTTPSVVSLGGVDADAADSSSGSGTSQQQTVSNVAIPATSYTVKDGDTLGDIAKALRAQFIAAGWDEKDIPPLWGGNGLLEAIANNNNISDVNSINADTELKIPAVPKPSTDGNGSAAFQAWSQTMGQEGAVSPAVTDNSGSNPSNNQSTAMSAERIKTEVSSFMNEYFPPITSLDGMSSHLNAKPKGDKQGPANNFGLLVWSLEVTMNSISQLAKEGNGKIDQQSYKIGQAAMALHRSLKAAQSSGGRAGAAQMKLITENYGAYRASLGL